jgi:hypothetical protein
MSLHRGLDGADPVRREPVGRLAGTQEERRVGRSWLLATGTLACPRCDAPVALPAGTRSPGAALGCPFCRHAGAVRDFLSLAAPSRPARVEVRVIAPARPRAG